MYIKKRKKHYILSSYHSDSFQRSYLIQNLLSNTRPIGHIQTHEILRYIYIYIYTITIQIPMYNYYTYKAFFIHGRQYYMYAAPNHIYVIFLLNYRKIDIHVIHCKN